MVFVACYETLIANNGFHGLLLQQWFHLQWLLERTRSAQNCADKSWPTTEFTGTAPCQASPGPPSRGQLGSSPCQVSLEGRRRMLASREPKPSACDSSYGSALISQNSCGCNVGSKNMAKWLGWVRTLQDQSWPQRP